MHRFPPRYARPVVAGVGVLAIVAGCGGMAPSGPVTPANESGRTPGSGVPASSAPTSAPVAATSSAPALATSETWTSPVDGRTVRHPAGWTVREDLGIIYLTSTAGAGGRLVGSGTLSPREIFIQVGQNSILSGGTTDPAVHLPEMLKLLIEGSAFTAGAPTPIDVAGRPSARIDASNSSLDMLAVSIPVSDQLFADVIAYAPKGEMAARAPLILEVIDSLTFPGS